MQVDEKALRHITEMGFSKELARQALMDYSNNMEAALNFLIAGNKPKPAQGPPARGIVTGYITRIDTMQYQNIHVCIEHRNLKIWP